MTRQAKNNYQCLNCKIDVTCGRCGNPRPMGSPFSLWLRNLSAPLNSQNFYTMDLDFVWWAYRQGWFITIEEKQNSSPIRAEQKEVLDLVVYRLSLIDRLLQTTIRGDRLITYKGHYNIIFQHTTPEDSEWMKINDKVCDKNQLYRLLQDGCLSTNEKLESTSELLLIQENKMLRKEIELLKEGIKEYTEIVKGDWESG